MATGGAAGAALPQPQPGGGRDAGQEQVVAFLSDPATHAGRSVERHSTHGAHVFLAGEDAYKIKRAVRLPFMDFSTVELRRRALQAELALNRTSAPRLYREVRPIHRGPDGAPTFKQAGPVLEWVLVMQRFAQEALFDNLARSNGLTPGMMDTLADAIVDMHGQAPRVSRDEGLYFARMAMDNVAALRSAPVDQARVELLGGALADSTRVLGGHLAGRAASGYVRRAHGDLHLRNIVLFDGVPTPFDALEFDADLAAGDVYFDLAFLLMDLDHRGLRALAHRVFNRYVNATADFAGLAGLPLFLAVRASIRAKIAGIEATGATETAARADKIAEAHSYLDLALSYLVTSPVRLFAIGGLSGTGKSTVALALAPELPPPPGPVVLRSDVIRKRLGGAAETERLPPASYTPEFSAQVYDAMIRAARDILRAGHSLIVDAVFAQQEQRQRIEAVASETGVEFRGIWLEAATSVRVGRVAGRAPDASDATPRVAVAQENYDIGALTWTRILSDASTDVVIARVRTALPGNAGGATAPPI